MENKLNEIIKEAKKLTESSDRLLDLANQLLELIEYPMYTMNGDTLPPEILKAIKASDAIQLGMPFVEETADFAREEFEQMTPLKVTHE